MKVFDKAMAEGASSMEHATQKTSPSGACAQLEGLLHPVASVWMGLAYRAYRAITILRRDSENPGTNGIRPLSAKSGGD